VRNVHVMLHKALADAVSWRYVAENVAEHAKPPRAGRRRRRLLAVDPVTLAALQVQREGQERERSFFGPRLPRRRSRLHLGERARGTPGRDPPAVQPAGRGPRSAPDPAARSAAQLRDRAALAAGVSAKIVSERLGHASVAFTLSQYTHLLPGLDRDAAGTVAAILLGPTSPPGTPGGGGPDAAR
jgi:integrase